MDAIHRDANRANWDERAEIHLRSRFYDVEGFVAGRCDLHPTEIEELGDVYDAAAALAPHGPFDVVDVSVGAINWLPSVRRWAAQVAAVLHPGGVLYMREVHPTLFATLERDGRLELVGPYCEAEAPLREESSETYTDADRPIVSTVVYE